MKLVFAVLVLASVVCADDFMTFEEYVAKFDKNYTPAEYLIRKAVFDSRITEIRLHNVREQSFKKTVNHFTDRTETELAAMLGFNSRQHQQLVQKRQAVRPQITRAQNVVATPDRIDWTEKGAITPVKNQGGCGSCWAFASTESIESCAFLNTGSLPVLAPQQLVDCAENKAQCGGTGGCEGATQNLAFEYAEVWGMVSESDYPYAAKDNACQAQVLNQTVTVGGFVDVNTNDMNALMAAIAKQPVTVGVAASDWFAYDKGVFTFDQCGSDLNHAVLLVGYGTDPVHGDYWKVQNSWGPTWGEGGFIRLQRSADDNTKCQTDKTPEHGFGCPGGPTSIQVCGTCGILYAPSYPTGCKLVSAPQ